MQLHTRHTNFIHIDTKVDFSRNVLLCQGERVEWHVAEGGPGEGVGRARARGGSWRQVSGQQGLGEQAELDMVAPPPHSSHTGGWRASTQTYWEHPEWWEMGARELRQEEALGWNC